MTMSPSQRVLAAIGAAAGACAIAVPATLALSHNPSFGQRIPVHVPSSAHIVSFDNHGGVIEAVGHRRHHQAHPSSEGRHDDPSSTAMPSSHEPEPGDDHGGQVEPRDDHHGGRASDGAGDHRGGGDDGGHGSGH